MKPERKSGKKNENKLLWDLEVKEIVRIFAA